MERGNCTRRVCGGENDGRKEEKGVELSFSPLLSLSSGFTSFIIHPRVDRRRRCERAMPNWALTQ